MSRLNSRLPSNWPTLKRYRGAFCDKVVLPTGGIGTGTIGFAGNGALRDWEIMNVPAKGYVPSFEGKLKSSTPSLMLRFHERGRPPQIKVMEGPLPLSAYEGAEGCEMPNANLPRFRQAEFSTAYPFGEVRLADPSCPLQVRLQAFNPFIPGNADLSGFPVAFIRCILSNPGDNPVKASVSFSLPNCIGVDGSEFAYDGHSRVQNMIGFRKNRNTWRSSKRKSFVGLFLDSEGVEPTHPAWGSISLTTPRTRNVTYRTSWAELGWGNMLLDYWDDFLDDGKLEVRSSGHETPMASLCVGSEIPAGGALVIPFVLAWHFPNRLGWKYEGKLGDKLIGNYYTEKFKDAWDVAENYWPQAFELEKETIEWVQAFLSCDSPKLIQEAALFNLSTIRTQTCFRSSDGRFFAWEGIFDRKGSCFGSCNHVWNYEQGLARFFPELAKSMHRVAFLEAMDERGMMPMRISLSADSKTSLQFAAADGQVGHIVRVFREWASSGDGEFLNQMWPGIRRAIGFCWIPGGWDADQDGVMEGCQHNTMDVEYYGANPQMGGWYLAALRASAVMATQVGDTTFADRCERLFNRGRKWIDCHLFNGDYYEQRVVMPRSERDIATGLRIATGLYDPENPMLQLGAGCLIDQLVGEWAAILAGLGPIFEPKHAKKTLRSILKYNARDELWNHFNHLRSYAMAEESAVLMASYPRGRRPKEPFPYYNEVMTGFEYVLAGHLLLLGLERDGLKCVRDIRRRYDGRKRNPYDEAECGHHYGRALASWGVQQAWTGFSYDARTFTMAFGRPGKHFWICPSAWGIAHFKVKGQIIDWEIQVKAGALEIAHLELEGRRLWDAVSRTVIGSRPWKGKFTAVTRAQ